MFKGFAKDRAIAPNLMAVATEVVENTRAHETYEVLGWAEPSVNYQTRKPHDFGSLLVFKNEDGTIFQAKPERSRSDEKGKAIKYETLKGNGSRAYLPAVDKTTRQKIAEVMGATVPSDGSFWDWVAANPQLTKVLTEGPGKTLALLSAGYIAIGLTGCHGGFQANEKDPTTGLKTKLEAPKLIIDLPRFLGADSPIVLAFDADTNPDTVDTVNAAMRRFGRLIEDSGAVVSIASWHGKSGKTKGVDDLIAADGVAAWEKSLAGALSLADWKAKHRKISPLTYLNGKGDLKLRPASGLADELAAAWGGCLAFNLTTETFWQYGVDSPGLWTEQPEDLIRQTIGLALKETRVEHGAEVVSGVYKLLRATLAVRKWREKSGVVPMRNGVLDIVSGELLPHSPDNRLCWQLPYAFDPAATCDPIQEWLAFTQGGDKQRVQLLRAYLKAVITGRVDLQRFIELVGGGGTGKSTFANLAIALVGLENCHVTELKRLETNRFETASLFGKRLVYITDSERYAGNVSVFKSLTGQDPLPFEQKYKQSKGSFTPNALVILATNEAIVSSDYTSGLERRRLTMPFTKAVEPSQRRDLLSISSAGITGELAEHLPGLLNWALSMPDTEMRDLVVNTAVSVPSLGQARAETLLASNPLAEWLDVSCVFLPGVRSRIGNADKQRITTTNSDGSTSREAYAFVDQWLYPNYRQYCDRSNIKAISLRRFADLLIDLCQNQLKNNAVLKGRDRDGAFILGIALRNNGNNHLPCPISGGGNEVVTEVGPIDETPDITVDLALATGDWDEPETIPATWQALPQADRQDAVTLLSLLKQAGTESDRKKVWFNPAKYSDPARAAVKAHLNSCDWGRPIIQQLLA
jgi:putative DNA primase/helicase